MFFKGIYMYNYFMNTFSKKKKLLHELTNHFYDYKIRALIDIYHELNITHYES